jgi:hypothetical protein
MTENIGTPGYPGAGIGADDPTLKDSCHKT